VRGVFISHSSKDRALTEAVCAQLGPYLERNQPFPDAECVSIVDWEMVVDYDRLEDGSPWPDQLHEWLARCHAGIVLLTENAARSAWVLKEVTILSWRLNRDPSFRLFIVRDPAVVTDAMLDEQKFTPLDIGRIQQVQAFDPADIATSVKNRLGAGRPPRTPFDDLVNDVANLLAGSRAGIPRSIAEELANELPEWKSDEPNEFYEAIARNLMTGNFGRLGGVGDLVQALVNSMQLETLESLFQLVSPYWVNPAAASELPLIASRTPPGVAAMNGEKLPIYTAKMYATRAHMSAFRYVYIPTNNANAGDCVEDVSRQIRERVERVQQESMTTEQASAWLANTGLPAYAVLPFVPLPADLVELRKRFGSVTFVVSTGSTLDRSQSIDDARWIEPELDTNVELEQQRSYINGMSVLQLKRTGQ
jgi:TIR domain